ncbi:hypothetical protein FGM00_07885 [Aggregatimonas sangjinii]|uniref:Zinc-ribbon domain-containing protein n=1 Tax=Aggregatimonas sangjinii TaxID=2583587 RepID=A0A5B7SSN4_9FLAO|nr:hypothetical protein [Aggregatimonas sangjinii]QCX00023.1 hypothetical protein FGM00_07885 [Aggregatimonas sangjinii]
MIVYGSRSTHLKSEQLRNAVCPNCETRGQMTASVYGRHAHVFWIPFFPMGKQGILECQHCHKGFKPKELDEKVKLEYTNFRRTVKTPLWKFAGLGIVALLIGAGIYSDKMNDAKVEELVASPAMFDKYTFKTETNYYSTFKVVEVYEDSIYVNYNDFETDKKSGIKDIDLEKNYDKDIYVLTNAQLKELHDSGKIKDIERDK